MKRLARKITLGKWRGAEWASVDKIPGDAVSNDLKTTGNALSFWRADVEGKGEDAAVLALLGTLQRVETIDIAFIDGDTIDGAVLDETEGMTLFSELRNLHTDIAEVDTKVLSTTAVALGREIYTEKTKRFTKQTVRQRLQEALDTNKLDWDMLPESMKSDLKNPA